MTIYDKLKANYEKGGLDTVIQYRDGDYAIASAVLSDGSIRITSWKKTIEECKASNGFLINCSKENIEGHSKESAWKIVETIARKSNYGVGDKVKTIGGIITKVIEVLEYDTYLLKGCGGDKFNLTELEPYFEEKTEELTLKQVCKELGRDIKIIK